jgi:hypothetical protein
MRTIAYLISGICGIVMISAISASGFTAMGISGIAKVKTDEIKSAIDRGASTAELHQIANQNGFALTVK